MKKVIFYSFIALYSLCLVSCSFSVKGEGETGEKEIKISNINEVDAQGNYRLIYLYDNTNPRIIVETYKNLLDNLKIKTSGSKLSISESKKVEGTDLYNVYIYGPQIETFDVTDSINVDINSQLRVSQLNINLSKSAKLLASNVVVDVLKVDLSGKAKASIQGTGNKLLLTASDESDFTSPFLELSEANVNISNVATAELYVKSKLLGKITNNSRLSIIGNPSKDIKTIDLAELKFINSDSIRK